MTTETAVNIFSQSSPATTHQNTMIDTQSARESQEVQAMMVIAKRFPRDPVEAMDRILRACTRKTLAQSAMYTYPKGGQEVQGPSIRLAETLAQEWGNIQYGIRELSQANNESTVEAFAWDIQTNTRQVKIFQVPHIRYSKKAGKTLLTDPRDIYELVANNGARRLRACILGVIPGDVIEEAVKQCDITLKASEDTSPEGLRKIAEGFAKIGITQEMIARRYQCRFEAIRPAQIVQLRKIYTSIKDGMSNREDWFDTSDTSNELNALLNEENKGAE